MPTLKTLRSAEILQFRRTKYRLARHVNCISTLSTRKFAERAKRAAVENVRSMYVVRNNCICSFGFELRAKKCSETARKTIRRLSEHPRISVSEQRPAFMPNDYFGAVNSSLFTEHVQRTADR